MGDSGALGAVGAEQRTMREELQALRAEQRELARSVDQLAQTCRSLATHLGIAAEPYRPTSKGGRPMDSSGFA